MARLKTEWLVIQTDPSRETSYVTFSKKEAAFKAVAETVAYLAKEELEAIEWDEEDAQALEEILATFEKKDYEEVYALWREFADRMGLDDDVEIEEVVKGD